METQEHQAQQQQIWSGEEARDHAPDGVLTHDRDYVPDEMSEDNGKVQIYTQHFSC